MVQLQADHPKTKLYGMELKPYEKGVSKPGERHHYIGAKAQDALYESDAQEQWGKYNDIEDRGLYAPDVPHVSVHIPGGVIPPKYITRMNLGATKTASLPFREWSHELVQDIIAKLVGWRQDGFTASHRRHRKHAGATLGAESIAASFRAMAKVAGVAKKQITWQGLPMKIEHEPGDVRKGTHKDGTSWERTMYDSYGYIPGTKGKAADGDAIDVYFSHAPVDGPVFEIRQLKKDTKAYDESKFMVGFGSAEEAKRAYLRHMPAWAFGELSPVGKTFDDFKTYLER